MKRAIVTALITLLLGAYLTIPTITLFDFSQRVLVLPRPNIDRLTMLYKKARALYADITELQHTELRNSLAQIDEEMESIEAKGRPGYRVVSQELFLEKYQTPHIARTVFPWVRYAGRMFERDTDEYLGWLYFIIVTLNILLLAYSRVHKRWGNDLKVIAWARWVVFCSCGMGASMSLIALINYRINIRPLKVLSLIFSGPARVYDQYGYNISWIWDERLILYSAIQWLLIGLVGCVVIKWLNGRQLLWCIIATLAVCAGLGLGLADTPDTPDGWRPGLLYGAHGARAGHPGVAGGGRTGSARAAEERHMTTRSVVRRCENGAQAHVPDSLYTFGRPPQVVQGLPLNLADALRRALNEGGDGPVAPCRAAVEAEPQDDDGALQLRQFRKGLADRGCGISLAETCKGVGVRLGPVVAVELALPVPVSPPLPLAGRKTRKATARFFGPSSGASE